jgi:hypothetical protein
MVIAKHKIGDGVTPEREEGSSRPELMHAAESLISAINMKDANAVALMLEHIFGLLDGDVDEPEVNHMEGRE